MKAQVLHICDKLGRKGSSVHGVSRLFSWWWPLFDKERFDLHLVTLRRDDGSHKFLQEKGIELLSLDKNKFDLFAYRDIVHIINSKKIDLLHLHGYGASNIGVLAARKTNIKCIVHEHFVDPAYPVYQHPFDYFLGRNVDKGIANCQSVKAFMVSQRHIPKHKIDVVYNGVPIKDFTRYSESAIEAEKKRLGIPSGVPVIATIGRLDKQKGNQYFLEAAKIILETGRTARFVLAGDGPLMENLQDTCRQLRITDHVLFTGHYENIPLLQSITDIQVFPSLWEGTTLTIFEAFAIGIPVVSTDVDGLGEVVQNNKTGLVVPPKDSRSLADRILELINNPDKAGKIGVNARKESKKYDIEQCVRKMESIYARISGK